MIIDSHVYFGRLPQDVKPGDSGPNDQVWLPEHVKPQLDGCAIQRVIAIDATRSAEHTRWLLKLADQSAYIGGVIGWVDLASDEVGGQLDEFGRHPKFIGVHAFVEDDGDADALAQAADRGALAELSRRNTPLDLAVRSNMIGRIASLAEALSSLRVTINIEPTAADDISATAPWADALAALAQSRTTFCKLPGRAAAACIAAASHNDATLKAYISAMIDLFGYGRIMYASDWPACGPGESYLAQFGAFVGALRPIAPADYRRVFGGNAQSHYPLGDMAWFAS